MLGGRTRGLTEVRGSQSGGQSSVVKGARLLNGPMANFIIAPVLGEDMNKFELGEYWERFQDALQTGTEDTLPWMSRVNWCSQVSERRSTT